jgi:hypothetical protein
VKLTSLAVLLMTVGFSWAAVAQDKPYLFQSRTASIQAVVEEIDHDTRLVTVRKPDGSLLTFTPSAEVRNLDQVSVGDVLHAEYTQSVRITVASVEGAQAGSAGVTGIARAEKGDMPGMAAIDSQITVATVADIDLEANTYKLEFDDGTINEYVALNPENLKMAEIGDIVIIEVTETLAAAVEEVDPAE